MSDWICGSSWRSVVSVCFISSEFNNWLWIVIRRCFCSELWKEARQPQSDVEKFGSGQFGWTRRQEVGSKSRPNVISIPHERREHFYHFIARTFQSSARAHKAEFTTRKNKSFLPFKIIQLASAFVLAWLAATCCCCPFKLGREHHLATGEIWTESAVSTVLTNHCVLLQLVSGAFDVAQQADTS